ncbi:MAG: hypothetical protein JXB10_12480 [Pirellulales bacterium]|nr:hypothetical protein [Pirellulales bacterium]
MTPETIQKHLLHHPFRPFRIFVSDGAVYDVRQPEMVLVGQRDVVIGLPKPGEQFPRDMAYCDLLHITRIEPINGRTKPKTRK